MALLRKSIIALPSRIPLPSPPPSVTPRHLPIKAPVRVPSARLISSQVSLYPHRTRPSPLPPLPMLTRNCRSHLSLDDSPLFSPIMSDSDQPLFDLDDLNSPFQMRHNYSSSFDSLNDSSASPNFPPTPLSTHISLDPMAFHLPPSPSLFDSGPFSALGTNDLSPTELDNQNCLFSDWLNDPASSPIETSAPISILPHSPAISIASPTTLNDPSLFMPYGQFPNYAKPSDLSHFSQYSRSSGDTFAEPTHTFDDFVSPRDTSLHLPQWASHLWDNSPLQLSRETSPQLTEPPSPLFEGVNHATHKQRFPIKSGFAPVNQIFLSSSAPTSTHVRQRTPSLARPYSRRAESVSESDDRDATIRRTKRAHVQDATRVGDKAADAQQRSLLRPPKLAPSAWQLYFTDFIQRAQASSTKKLNVAQAAKEAGQEYAKLSAAQKDVYKRRSQVAKEARERELTSYMRTLTPEDIKRENAFRTAQRKAGRSRKANMKDPNAPKKPLSAYFMFLQRIRSDPDLVRDVFCDETETTKQSVLAAAKWRSMTDDERKPFLAQAEQDKLEYEAARKLYENGSIAYESSIDFGTMQFQTTTTLGPTHRQKSESGESDDSEGFMTDDSAHRVKS